MSDLSLRAAVLVGGGAILGALLRWVAGTYLTRGFPYGTLLVNVLGCFLIGVFLFRASVPSPEMRLFVAVGFLGALTTMSAFAYETILMVDAGEWGRAALNVFVNPVLCLLATFAGRAVALSVG